MTAARRTPLGERARHLHWRPVKRAACSRRATRVALAALAAASLSVVAGCGTGAQAGNPTASPQIGAHTFVDLVPELPNDLDDTGTPGTETDLLLPSWSGELVRPAGATPGPNAVLPPDDAVVPYLATSWTSEPDGDYVFQLRRGVRGPTGDLFTAEDVRWSLERAIARDPEAPFLYSLAHIDLADPVTILSTPQRSHQRDRAEPVPAVGAGRRRRDDLRPLAVPRQRDAAGPLGARLGLHARRELLRLLRLQVRAAERDRAERQPRLLADALVHAGRDQGRLRARPGARPTCSTARATHTSALDWHDYARRRQLRAARTARRPRSSRTARP